MGNDYIDDAGLHYGEAASAFTATPVAPVISESSEPSTIAASSEYDDLTGY